MLVKDVMTPNPITIDPNQPVLEALLVMYQKDIRRLPVMERGNLVGIICDRDIKQTMGRPALVSRQAGEEPEMKLSVRDVMTQNLITVSQDDNLKDAIELLVENKISGLPVVDHDQRLVGVVSAIDVLRYCLDLLERV
ncbi:MAG: CBS domain-containing protein [Nitrospiria bacterium]